MIHRTSSAARRPRESGDRDAVPSRICAGGANFHFGGYGSPLSRGRRKSEDDARDSPPVLCESALIESRYWEVIAVNRAGDRSPHERSDMRVVKTGSDFKTGSTPDIASLIRATVEPGYLLHFGGYGSSHSRGRRKRCPPVLCESALIESRCWEVIAVNRAGNRSPHERGDMRVVKQAQTSEQVQPGYRFAHPGYSRSGLLAEVWILAFAGTTQEMARRCFTSQL